MALALEALNHTVAIMLGGRDPQMQLVGVSRFAS